MSYPRYFQRLEVWPLQAPYHDSSSEIIIPGSKRQHVNLQRYCDVNGELNFVLWVEIRDDEAGEWKSGTATAAAIGSNVVLTAAHNLRGPHVNDKRIHRAAIVKICVGYHNDGTSEPTAVETRYGVMCAVPRDWKSLSEPLEKDMGMIKLDRPFTAIQPAGFKTPPLGALAIRVLGFPYDNKEQVLDRCANAFPSGCMYEVVGEATHDKKSKMIAYKLSTGPGNSGGPVCLIDDPKTVVATHHGKAPGESNKFNVATPVDEDFINACRKLFKIQAENVADYEEPVFVNMQLVRDKWTLTKKRTEREASRTPVSSAESSSKCSETGYTTNTAIPHFGEPVTTITETPPSLNDAPKKKESTIDVSELEDDGYVNVQRSDVDEEGPRKSGIAFFPFPVAATTVRWAKHKSWRLKW